ncbi:MAG: hypothetical protein V8S92_08445 [Oscillospiraceae bacterium]
MTICSACSEERPNSFFFGQLQLLQQPLILQCQAGDDLCLFLFAGSKLCFQSCMRLFQLGALCFQIHLLQPLIFRTGNVTISSVLLVCISLFSMQTLYHKTRQKASIFNAFRPFYLFRQQSIPSLAVGFRLLNF